MTNPSISFGDDGLRYREVGAVGVLMLNRPSRRNALNAGLRFALREQLQALSARPPAVLVLTGSGEHFCAGGDIDDMRAADFSPETSRRRLIEEYHPIVRGLAELPCPVVAAIDGCCYGAGFSLALACDYLLCSDRARFCLSFLRLGVVPDCGVLYTLPRLVGSHRAKALMLTTREMNAAEALALGICAETTSAEKLHGRAMEFASQLAHASPIALRGIKQGVQAAATQSLGDLLTFEAAAQAECRATTYHQDALRAFLEKQPLAYAGTYHED